MLIVPVILCKTLYDTQKVYFADIQLTAFTPVA